MSAKHSPWLALGLLFLPGSFIILNCNAVLGLDSLRQEQGDASASYTIRGVVTGLNGSGLVLEISPTKIVSVPQSGPFVFPESLPAGTSFQITVLTQPTSPAQLCTVTYFYFTWPTGPATMYPAGYVWWQQVENPANAPDPATVFFLVESPTSQVSDSGFLGLSSFNCSGASYLCGLTDGDYWWAVGMASPWNGGMPTFVSSSAGTSPNNGAAPRAQLWLR